MAKVKSKSQIGRGAKRKGAVGELEVAALLRKYGFDAERGRQYHGRGDAPDVKHSMKGLHVEVKRAETFPLWAAMDQACDDMNKGDMPVVFHRKSRKPWIVVLDAEDFLKIMQKVYE